MELERFTYLALLIFTLSYPLYKSFEDKIQFYKKLKYVLPAIVITAVPFLIWDVIFEKHHIWQFNPDYTLGFKVLGLPIEEWLFFFIVPYACFFLYEVIDFFSHKKVIKYIKPFTIVLAIGLFVISIFKIHLTYTFIVMISASVMLIIIAYRQKISPILSKFFKGYFISLLPFFLVNGVLTKMPVVLYNDAENLSFRIYSIPVEDMVYLLSLLFINFSIYEILKRNAQRKEVKSANNH